MKKMNKKVKAVLCTASIIGVVGVAGVMAYFTDTDNATNTITIGKITIDLTEPLWDATVADKTNGDKNNNNIPDYAENVAPNTTVTKDPQVQNTGINPAYVYLKVTIPAKEVITANENGTLKNNGNAVATQLFTYNLEENSKWVEIEGERKTNINTETNKIESYTYVYYYNQALAPNATTDKLFTQVKYENVIEGQNDEATVNIDIVAYAIQSDNLPEGTTIPQAYTTLYTNQHAND